MKNTENLIGKKVYGFKFENVNPGYIPEDMDSYIGKIGQVTKIYKEGVCRIEFEDDFFNYPTEQVLNHLVECEEPVKEEIPTYTKEDLKTFYNIGFVNGVNNKDKSSCLEFEKEYQKLFKPTKEEQLTEILGSKEKVAEIMELFKSE